MAGELKTRVIVLGARRYSFVNKESGEIIEGTKVFYVEPEGKVEKDTQGFLPSEANLPLEYYETLGQLPGIYDAEISLNLGTRKPGLKVTGFTLVGPVEFVG